MTAPHLPTFYDYVRRAPFGGRLTESQVAGMERILAAWAEYGDADDRKLAYVLATAFHETGGRMQPVREGFAKTDAGARRVVASRRYGREVDGQVYYGRGDVQLTWAGNYERLGNALDLPLLDDPDLALDPVHSGRILVEGMMRGLYTPTHGLPRYFGADADPEGARRIVNGRDKAKLIAGYWRNFLDSLEAARSVAADQSSRPVAPAPAVIPTDGANLKTDPVAIGGVLAGVGGLAGAASMIEPILRGVQSPWGVAALAVVLLAAWLVVSGRVKLKREGGV